MLFLLLFFLELTLLFFLSKRVQRNLGRNLYKMTGNKNLTIYTMSVIFLPGTFIHEMAHFLFALFLLVPVGEMDLLPKIEGETVRLGSVTFAKTDPVRRFLIGVAPFLTGTAVILAIIYYFVSTTPDAGWWVYLAVAYFIFTISNSMFMSKKDMEGIWIFLGILFFAVILVVIFGVRFELNNFSIQPVFSIFETASYFLLIPLVLDIIALLTLRKV